MAELNIKRDKLIIRQYNSPGTIIILSFAWGNKKCTDIYNGHFITAMSLTPELILKSRIMPEILSLSLCGHISITHKDQARVARSMVSAKQRLMPWKPIDFDTS